MVTHIAKRFEQVAIYTVIVVIGIGVFTLIFCIWFRCKTGRGGDHVNYLAIFLFFHNIADFATDLLFALILYLKELYLLFYFAIGFVLIPYIMSLIVGTYWIERWRNEQQPNDRFIKYFKKYDTLLYTLTVMAGFYPAFELVRSKFFYIKAFNLPLKKSEYFIIKNIKFINIGLLEVRFFFFFMYPCANDGNFLYFL